MSTEQADLSSLRIDETKRGTRTERNNSRIYIGIAVLLGLAVAFFLIKNFASSVFSPGIEVTLVRATLQSPSQADAVLTATGYVVAQRKAAVASKGTGRLVYLGVVEGDRVTAGQIIARLENDDIQAQLDEARANLKLQQAEKDAAQKELERQRTLLAANLTSQANFDVAEANYAKILAAIELAKAQVRAAEVALENTLIRAPFDGTVLTKNADVGEIVAPLAAGANSRAAVVTLADMTSLQVEADVSESNIQRIQAGQDCEITLDAYPNQPYAGFVAKIVPTADRAKATVMVKVGFNDYDERVLPEMSCKVLFLKPAQDSTRVAERPVLVVPQSAIVNHDDGTVVYRVQDDKALKVTVTTGPQFGNYIEIKQGLQEADRVIAAPGDKIKDGVKVTVK